MQSSNYLLLCAALTSIVASPVAASAGPAQAAHRSWAADNGNGTYSNPLFYDEFSDPDMIRVGADYYLTGTAMHNMPGLPILHSRDLVNWRIIAYAFDRLDLGPDFRLEEGKQIYGQGIWAPSFRYHNGAFLHFCQREPVRSAGVPGFESARAMEPQSHRARTARPFGVIRRRWKDLCRLRRTNHPDRGTEPGLNRAGSGHGRFFPSYHLAAGRRARGHLPVLRLTGVRSQGAPWGNMSVPKGHILKRSYWPCKSRNSCWSSAAPRRSATLWIFISWKWSPPDGFSAAPVRTAICRRRDGWPRSGCS